MNAGPHSHLSRQHALTDSARARVSAVVHMVGGFSGLMGAIVVGPRKERFDAVSGAPNKMHDGNKTLQSLGAFILWFGWYGFNCGSTLMISGGAAQVGVSVGVCVCLSLCEVLGVSLPACVCRAPLSSCLLDVEETPLSVCMCRGVT
eukprot:2782160-Rhodomonas_salina.1